MSRSISEIAFETSNKLLLERNQIDNSLYADKVEKVIFKSNNAQEERVINFKGVEGSVALICVSIDASSSADVEVTLNEVVIFKRTCNAYENINLYPVLKAENTLNIKITFNSVTLCKTAILLKGNLINEGDGALKIDFNSNGVVAYNSNHVTQNNIVMSQNIYLNNFVYDEFDKILDCVYNFASLSVKSNLLVLYLKNNKTFIVDEAQNLSKELEFGYSNIAILPSCDATYKYLILSIFLGGVFLRKYDSALNLLEEIQLSDFGFIKANEISSIVADSCTYSFIVSTIDGFTYYCTYSLLNDSVSIKPLGNCNSANAYKTSNGIMIVSLVLGGVKFEEYNITNYPKIISTKTYINADYGFYYNNKNYIIVDDMLQEVE